MYFISSKTLVKKFKNNSFQDYEVAPYFFVYTLLTTLAVSFTFSSSDPWSIASGVIVLIITYGGIMHIRNKNGGTFGNGYLNKWFTLGWIILIRTLLLGIPFCVTFMVIGTFIDRRDGIAIGGAFFNIVYNIVFYYWLGKLVEETNQNSNS